MIPGERSTPKRPWTPGLRRSQSTRTVRHSIWANERASAEETVVFPSWGSALVTRTILCRASRRVATRVRRLRNSSPKWAQRSAGSRPRRLFMGRGGSGSAMAQAPFRSREKSSSWKRKAATPPT